MNDIVDETVALIRWDLRGAALHTELAERLVEVTVDRVQIQQVLLNLCANAIDAMHEVMDRPRRLSIQTKAHEERAVVVAVEDSGLGFDENQMERLFETFYTTKPAGLGMGLSICRSIIEAHGGRLWAQANDGPGVTFRFSLPVEGPGTGQYRITL